MSTVRLRWHTDEVGTMLIIKCPWCGPRDETEFAYGGEAGISRPLEPDNLNDADWADYLFMRKNPKGLHNELWQHSSGCRRWFTVARNTVTYEILTTSPIEPGKPQR